MKKGYKHTDLSDKVCATEGCKRRLKKRVVETIKDAKYCYQCSHPKRKANKIANAAKRASA
jgi:hypothetical protein